MNKKKSPTTPITFRATDNLLKWLEAKAKQHGIKRSPTVAVMLSHLMKLEQEKETVK